MLFRLVTVVVTPIPARRSLRQCSRLRPASTPGRAANGERHHAPVAACPPTPWRMQHAWPRRHRDADAGSQQGATRSLRQTHGRGQTPPRRAARLRSTPRRRGRDLRHRMRVDRPARHADARHRPGRRFAALPRGRRSPPTSRSAVDRMWPVLAPPATSGPDETTHRPEETEKPPSYALSLFRHAWRAVCE